MLIVISGLPGVGKIAVAAGVAARLPAVHLSVDAAEDAMLGAGLPSGWQTGVAAYEATRAAAEQNLALGWDVVIDAVNDSEPARWTWRHAAERTAAALRFVVLACSHQKEHRRRLEGGSEASATWRNRPGPRSKHAPAPTSRGRIAMS